MKVNNWKTSLFGILAGGFLAYHQYAQDQLDATNLAADLAVAGFGVSAKDKNVTGGTKQQ